MARRLACNKNVVERAKLYQDMEIRATLNQISQLTKHINGLQKLEAAVIETEALHWNSPEVTRGTALLVRNTFDTFEQKWRDMLQRNKFFVFCIPRYMVLDGPPVFHHDPHGGDEVNQKNFEDGCLALKADLIRIRKAMQDERTSLLNLQNHNALVPAFSDLDDLGEQLNLARAAVDKDKAIQSWDDVLRSKMKKHGLDGRFNTAFGDSRNTALERIARRELALSHVADSLSTGPVDKQRDGGTIVNIGNNNTIGVFNTGDNNDFEQITVNINTLAVSHKELADSLQLITNAIQNADVESSIKEQAADAVLTVSTELVKPVEKQKGFKIEDAWKKLELLTKAGDLAVKVHPMLAAAWNYIQHHFPHLFN